MKTIKEKAEEYAAGFHQSIQRMCNESFVDGANYVLEQIEEWLRTTEYTSYKPAEHDLCVLIEQLKN